MKKIVLFLLLLTGFYLFLLFEPTSKGRTVKEEDAQEHIAAYIGRVREYAVNNRPGVWIGYGNKEKNHSSIEIPESDKYDNLFVSVFYENGKERFSIDGFFGADDLSEINEKIDKKTVYGILEIISGYVFTEEEINCFIDCAVNSGKSNEYYVAYDEKNIGFFEDWRMYIYVQESHDPEDTAYDIQYGVNGYTKDGCVGDVFSRFKPAFIREKENDNKTLQLQRNNGPLFSIMSAATDEMISF